MDFSQNYFEIFQLPVVFDIDADQLASRYRQLQSSVHPDKYAGASEHEKRLSLQWATQINAANDTLKSGLDRAIYLLELSDIRLQDNPQLAPEFLMVQIELREQLEDIEDADDALVQIDLFKEKISALSQSCEADFAALYQSDLKAAEAVVYEMQFINKLRLAAEKLEAKLLDY